MYFTIYYRITGCFFSKKVLTISCHPHPSSCTICIRSTTLVTSPLLKFCRLVLWFCGTYREFSNLGIYLEYLYGISSRVFEPTCANARWALMSCFLSVCPSVCLSVRLSVTRQKLLDNNSYLWNYLR